MESSTSSSGDDDMPGDVIHNTAYRADSYSVLRIGVQVASCWQGSKEIPGSSSVRGGSSEVEADLGDIAELKLVKHPAWLSSLLT